MRVPALLLTLLCSVLGDARITRRRQPHTVHDVARRYSSTRWTYFAPGLGACGGTNTASDYIVALNTPQWAGGAHCGKQITMAYGGKTMTASFVNSPVLS